VKLVRHPGICSHRTLKKAYECLSAHPWREHGIGALLASVPRDKTLFLNRAPQPQYLLLRCTTRRFSRTIFRGDLRPRAAPAVRWSGTSCLPSRCRTSAPRWESRRF